MTAVLALLDNFVDATQSDKLHFFAILHTDGSNERWSKYKYLYANR